MLPSASGQLRMEEGEALTLFVGVESLQMQGSVSRHCLWWERVIQINGETTRVLLLEHILLLFLGPTWLFYSLIEQ